ncbi:MAG: lipoyl protein ligase domain-containing protein, partial [Caldisericaceae bacterium]
YFKIEAYVGNHNELLVSGNKVSGCAASVKGGGFLYHSTLLLNSDLEKMKHALTPKMKYSEYSKFIRSNRVSTMNIYGVRYIPEEILTERIYFDVNRVLSKG